MNWKEEEDPLRYGIMFEESEGQEAETKWYEDENERDEALSYLLESGKIEIVSPSRRSVRIVEPYAFSVIDAAPTFYTRAI